jgi:carboxynorspermidine decarboxylase
MDRVMFSVFDEIETPAYVVDETALIRNLEILKEVKEKSGAKILLAQKAFSMFSLYPLIMEYLDGTTSSGLYEARLAHEETTGQVHVYCPAYKEDEIGELAGIADHIIFNSKRQLFKYKDECKGVSLGLRINPECSTQDTPIYDPCAPGSRLGVTFDNFDEALLDHIEGLHIHTLCEQDADDLKVTLDAFVSRFGKYLGRLKWLNLGGGHHITRAGYDRELLIGLVKDIRNKYGLEVYLEPGEAVALNAGYLVCEVMDMVRNDFDIAILDASAACHMPDVIEMPYRPPLYGASYPSEKPYTYRLAGRTCLAGDVIGDYSFDDPLRVGDKLCFMDMAIYSMVKNNTFNGMPLPDICVLGRDGSVKVIKKFNYDDFKGRLS